MTLQSHPDKTLQVHVAEVREAAHRIWAQHSPQLHDRSMQLLQWLDWAVTMHDVGKGCAAFQSYIKNVNGFKQQRRLKAHTPMSFVVSLAHGKNNAWNWRQTLAVAACAAGHHSNFKTHGELSHILSSTDGQNILIGQLEGFDWDTLSAAVLETDYAHDQRINPCFATDHDLDDLTEWFEETLIEESRLELNLPDGIAFRLQCQLTHSMLLEADKAYLIISPNERDKFRHAARPNISPEVVVESIAEHKRSTPSRLDPLRDEVRNRFMEGLSQANSHRIQTMTLPTGSGKTLLAATWALKQREQFQSDTHTPPVIIVLPFLSIIEQTQDIYTKLLGQQGGLLSYHSLSIREHQDSEDPDTAEFFLDTWHGDVVVTTFDQFLFALLDSRTRHQMRFHQLCDALIVMDEVQALPCVLWDIVAKSLAHLASLGNCRLLAMSATQTGFLPDAIELIDSPRSVFSTLERYQLLLRHEESISIDDFIHELVTRAERWREQRVLIVLNTRKSARKVRDTLSKVGFQIEFLSADMTPRDRLIAIERIKKGKPCIVVSTQCIEAGVDIDMSLVIRDFAPLDSLIQVAGRCNRNFNRPRETIEFVSLHNEKGKPYATMIYDTVLLQETRRVLRNYLAKGEGKLILEEHVFDLTQAYFATLSDKKNLGETHTKSFARWEELPSVRDLLRGRQADQVSFIVIDQDPALKAELERVKQIEDRWQRRRALRNLSARIAAISVSVYVREDVRPERYAERDATGNFWLLREEFYNENRGLDLTEGRQQMDDEEDTWGVVI
jgi:CRISPR-associated endonuclease/helicase Cas3